MATVIDNVSIAANATNANVLSTSKLVQVPMSARGPVTITLYAAGSAVGLRHALSIEQESVLDDSLVNTNNRVPQVPDDFVGQWQANPGERLTLTARNTTAGALTYNYRVEMTG